MQLAAVLCSLAVAVPVHAAQRESPRTNPPDEAGTNVAALVTPGNDDCRGLSWEPTIAVDPNNPLVVAIAQGGTIQVSIDGGANFNQTLTATVPGPAGGDPGWCAGGDPSLAFDAVGRLYITVLGTRCGTGQICNPPMGSPSPPCNIANGRDVFLSRWTRVGNLFGNQLGPINVTAGAGQGAPNNADKEWLAIDTSPASPYTGNVYVAWSDIDQEPWAIWTSRSTNGGSTWSPAQQLSIASEGRRTWPAHNTVAPNGDAYVAYHAQANFLDGAPGYDVPDGKSGQVVVHRSTDGGGSWTKTATNPFDTTGTSSECDTTWNRQDSANGVIPNASFWTFGTIQPWILADPYVAGRLYVICSDDPDDDVDVGDAMNVVIARSSDSGATWSAPTRVDDTPGTGLSVFPTAAIDLVSGAIGVTWYDNRSGATGTSGDRLLDLRLRVSWDGGLSWLPSVDVNDGQLDPGLSTSCRFCCPNAPCAAGQPQTLRIGEYNGIDWGQCTAHMVWADNQVCNAGGSLLDTFYDRDPEAGGDLTPPSIACPPNTSIGCTSSTHPNALGYATATDDCDLDPEVGWNDLIEPGNCPQGGVTLRTIRRIWNAVDLAGNLNTCEQIITVTDFDPPILQVPGTLQLVSDQGCVPGNHPLVIAWANLATANDACTISTVNYNLPAVLPGTCGAGIATDVLFTAGDGCGNGAFAFATIVVRVPEGSGERFCYGDGSGTACPCGNVGLVGHGCNIAQATGGICLTAQDFNPNGLGGGSVRLLGTDFPTGGSRAVQAIRSTTLSNALAGIVFEDGKLCLGMPISRLATLFTQDGKVSIPLNHVLGAGRFNYQLWFRDGPDNFCVPFKNSNLSSAVTLTW